MDYKKDEIINRLNSVNKLEDLYIEKMISQYSQSQPIVIEFDYAIYILILVIIISINSFLPQIECLSNRLNIFLKRKI